MKWRLHYTSPFYGVFYGPGSLGSYWRKLKRYVFSKTGISKRKVEQQYKLLNEGKHRSQLTPNSANFVGMGKVLLNKSGFKGTAVLMIDSHLLGRIDIWRGDLGEARFSLPVISFRMASFPQFILANSVLEAIRSLIEQILPPVVVHQIKHPKTWKASSWDGESLMVDREELTKAILRIEKGPFIWLNGKINEAEQ